MAGEEGFKYEKKINKLLQEHKIQDKSFQPAGSDPNAPDALFTYQGEDYKMEVKLDLKADFGQGSLDYDLKKDKWVLSGAKTDAAKHMREFLEEIGTTKLINSTKGWGGKGPPRKFTVPFSRFKKTDVDYDYKNFTDKFITIPDASAIGKYYASKETYYIQIGGYGLFHMVRDVAELGTTKFVPQVRLRIRLKRGGSNPIYNYRFSTALQVQALPKSKVDLEDKDDLAAIAARAKSKR